MHNGPRFFVSSSWQRPVSVISENIDYKLQTKNPDHVISKV